LVHCEDSRNDPRVGRDCSFGSAVILPLVVNGEVRGIVQAFSKRSFAFTASSMDSLEKLADAVIFSTHGIVTQRRLATAKSSLFPSSAPLGPKPGQALSPLTASFSTPAASAGASSPASDAAVMTPAAFPATSTPVAGVPTTSAYSTDLAPLPPAAHVASALAPPVAVKPVAVASLAEPIAEPVVQYVKPKPREKFTARPKVAPRHDRGKSQGGSTGKSSAGKWIAVTAAVAAISAASAWYAAKQHRQVAVVATASAAGPTLTQAPAYVQPVEVAHPVVSESPTLKAEAAVARTVVPTRVEHVVSPPAKHEAAPREPKPEPIVLAESAPRAPKPVDLDTVVPVKLPTALPTSPNASQIALPAEAKAIPKLAAPPVTVRTGPVLVSRVNPVYPQMARSARIQGVVELGVHIRKDGTVEKVTQLSGQAILAAAAKEAVQKWRYEPAKVNGQPIESDTTVKLTFDFYH
jgi:protein TonB